MWNTINSLSLEEKVGQLFFIGISGTEFDDTTRKLINDISPGGVCLFSRNIRAAEQVRGLLDSIANELPVIPFLSVDQEGGLVDRLRRIVTPMPSAAKLQKPENAVELARITAEVLSILGFNMNFAPVVDVPTSESANAQNGLQSRYFASDAESVTLAAGSYLETLQNLGILGSIKHFPGLGAIVVDSHEELPFVNKTREELEATDLIPYRSLLSSAHVVMVAHCAYPKLDLQERDQDGKLLPSSLSFNIITKLLRSEIGFNGLVVTDDLEMGAIVRNYGMAEACRMAIKAGIDMLLICAGENAIREGYDAVLESVRSGEISEELLNGALHRIAQTKSLIKQPANFDSDRLAVFSGEISALIENLK